MTAATIDHGALALSRVAQQYTGSAKFLALLQAIMEQSQEIETVFQQVAAVTDIDACEGVQLDIIGQIVGISRYVKGGLPVAFFGFALQPGAQQLGEEGLADIGARFRDDAEAATGTNAAGDQQYRLFLRARIARNHTHGNIEGVIAALQYVFDTADVLVEDKNNMSFDISIGKRLSYPEQVLTYLLQIIPKPAGVRINARSFFDANNVFGFYGFKYAEGFGDDSQAHDINAPLLLNGTFVLDGTEVLDGQGLAGRYYDTPLLGGCFAEEFNIYGRPDRYTPALDLDFTPGSISYPGLVCSRAGVATRRNASGLIESVPANTLRISKDPLTGVFGLLVEESRTNLSTYSEQIDNAAWTKAATISVTVNATTAPDGSGAAEKLVEVGTSTADRYVTQDIDPIVGGGTYTGSVFLKAAENRYAQIRVSSGNGTFSTLIANVDLQAGTVNFLGAFGGAVSGSASIEAWGSGWYRVAITGVLAANVTLAGIDFYCHNGSTTSYAGTPGNGFYVWGAQFEAGAFATSYIPTTSAAVTRNADLVTLPLGTYFNAAAGTMLVEAEKRALPPSGRYPFAACLNDGTFNNYISLATNASGNHRGTIQAGGVVQWDIDEGGVFAGGTIEQWAVAWASNDGAGSANGGAPVTTNTLSVPSVTRLELGNIAGSSTNLWNGHIFHVKYFAFRMSNSELRDLTV